MSLSVTPYLHGTSVTSLAGASGSDTPNAQGHGTFWHHPTLAESPSSSQVVRGRRQKQAAPDPGPPKIPSCPSTTMTPAWDSVQRGPPAGLSRSQPSPEAPAQEPRMGEMGAPRMGEMGAPSLELPTFLLSAVCLSVQPVAGPLWRCHSHN